jgi:hypothetical protein
LGLGIGYCGADIHLNHGILGLVILFVNHSDHISFIVLQSWPTQL